MKTFAWGYWGVLVGMVALSACGGSDSPAGTKDGGGDTDGQVADGDAFPKEVGDILVPKCGGCHQEGGIGTFAMDYAHAKPFAALIKAETAQRLMPPMPVNNDGTCQTYKNARWLSDEEIQTIGDWVDDGAPPAAKGVKETELPELSTLDNPELTMTPPMPYTPMGTTNSPNDNYRCFPIKPNLDKDMYITAAEIVPGSKKVAHHMIVYLPPAQDQAWVDEEDAKDAEEGYPCFGSVSPHQALPIVLWAPGSGRIDLPEGTGIMLPKGRTVVMQMHYNLAQGTEADQTQVKLRLKETVSKEALFYPLLDSKFSAPAGEELYMTTPQGDDGQGGRLTIPVALPAPGLMTIYGSFPHMHVAGRVLKTKMTVDGTDTCLTDVDRWDFAWQEGWFYDSPIVLPAGNVSFEITCGFNTKDRNTATTWGENTQDEMCLNFLYVTSPLLGQLKELGGL